MPGYLSPASFITAQPLDDFSIRYGNEQDDYAALKVFVPHPVPKKTGTYYSLSKDNLRVQSTFAPSGTTAPMHGYSATARTFTALEHGIKGLVLEKDARDFDKAVSDLDEEQAMQNMDSLLIELEAAAYTLVSTTANYPAALVATGTTDFVKWNVSGSDPVEDVRARCEAVKVACGKRPNAIAMSMQVYKTLRQHASIIDRVKYTAVNGVVPQQAIADLFECQEIIISDVIKNTATEGAADSLTRIWDDTVLVFVKDPTPRLRSMTYGKCFMPMSGFYTKTIDAQHLGRGLGAHWLESGMEYVMQGAASVSSSDNDFVAGSILSDVL